MISRWNGIVVKVIYSIQAHSCEWFWGAVAPALCFIKRVKKVIFDPQGSFLRSIIEKKLKVPLVAKLVKKFRLNYKIGKNGNVVKYSF